MSVFRLSSSHVYAKKETFCSDSQTIYIHGQYTQDYNQFKIYDAKVFLEPKISKSS